MKIIANYLSCLHDNGAETIVTEYLREIDKNNFLPILIVNRRTESKNQEIVDKSNIRLYSLGDNDFLSKSGRIKRVQRLVFPLKILRILKKNKVDILHVHMSLLKYIYPIRFFIKNIKIVYTCHSLPKRYFDGINKKELFCAKSLVKNNGMKFIALHNKMAEEINHIFSINDCITLYNGINIELYSSHINKKEARHRLNLSMDEYIIGNVARFAEMKNHLFLIDIFNQIHKKETNSKLLLVANHDDLKVEQDVIKKIHEYNLDDYCIILSNRNDIDKILPAMDVFVFPSKYEGFGLAFIEAQASGISCIISDAIPEEAIASENVTRMSLRDSIDRWANEIMHPISNVKPNREINDFDIKVQVKKLESIYLI